MTTEQIERARQQWAAGVAATHHSRKPLRVAGLVALSLFAGLVSMAFLGPPFTGNQYVWWHWVVSGLLVAGCLSTPLLVRKLREIERRNA